MIRRLLKEAKTLTMMTTVFSGNLSAQFEIKPVTLPGSAGPKQLGRFPITCHERVWNLAFSPDGRQLYSVGNTVMRHNWRKPGRPQYLWMPRNNESMFHAVFSPDRAMFARLGNGVHIHRTKDGKLLNTLVEKDQLTVHSGCWGPFGKRFVTGGEAKIVLWDIESEMILKKISQGKGSIDTVGISPDGKIIVAGNRDWQGTEGLLFLHQIEDSAPPLQLEEGTGWSSRIPMIFAPDGKTVAGPAELNGRSRFCIWNVATGKVIHRFRGGFNHAAYSSDGKWIAACGLNNLQVWNARTGEEIFKHQDESINQHIWSVTFTLKGDVLAAGTGKSIRFFDTKTWKIINPPDTHHTPILTTAFSSDGSYLLSGDKEGRLVLWDWQKKSPLWVNTELTHMSFMTIEGQDEPIRVNSWGISALSISRDNSLIAVCANANRSGNPGHLGMKAFSIIDTKSGKVITSFGDGGGARRGIIFSPDNKIAYTGSHTGTIDAWNVTTGKLIRKIGKPMEPGHEHSIVALRFADDSNQAIWWNGEHHKLAKRRLSDGKDTVILSGGSGTAQGNIHLPSYDNWIASGKTIWNLPGGELIKLFHRNESFHASGRPHPSGLISIASVDESAILVDMLTGKPMNKLEFGPGEILSLTFSPDGESLVAAGEFGIKHLDCSTLFSLWEEDKFSIPDLWELMGSNNAGHAYQATWALGKRAGCLDFLEKKLQPAAGPTVTEVTRLRSAMEDPDGQVAATAARMLLDMGIPLSEQEIEDLRRPDERFRSSIALPAGAGFTFNGISHKPALGPAPILLPLSHRCQSTRALMLLESNRSEKAVELLHKISDGYSDSPITKQAQAAIKRLKNQPSK